MEELLWPPRLLSLPPPPPHIDTTLKSSTISSKLIDGYIKGATVFYDANDNGILDPGEVSTTTDEQGNFILSGGTGNLVATGGIDISTNLPFKGVFTAPAGATVIGPLSTLIQSMIDESTDAAQAEARLKAALGLDASIDINSFDPISALSEGAAGAIEVFAAAVQVNNLLTQVSAAMAGAGLNQEAAFADLAAALADHIAGSSGPLALDDPAFIKSVIEASAEGMPSEAAAKIKGASADLAGLVAESNAAVAEAAQGTGSGKDILTDIARVAVVAQGAAADAVEDAFAASSPNLDNVLDEFTGDALEDKVDKAEVGDVTGDGTDPDPKPDPDPDPKPDPDPDPKPDPVDPDPGPGPTPDPGPGPTPDPKPPAKTFTVAISEGVVTFGGTATGEITFTVAADGKMTFKRDGVTAGTKVDIDDGLTITGDDTAKLAADADDLSVEIAGKLKALLDTVDNGFDANGKTYSIKDTWENISAADPEVLSGAESYAVVDNEDYDVALGESGNYETFKGAAAVAGSADINLTGTDEDDVIDLSEISFNDFTGTIAISGGKGADTITLGNGQDIVVVKAGDSSVAPVVAGVNTSGTLGTTAVAAVLEFDLSSFSAKDAVIFTIDGESNAVGVDVETATEVEIDGVTYTLAWDSSTSKVTLTQPAGSEAPVTTASAAQEGGDATGTVDTNGVTGEAATADSTVYVDVVSVLTTNDTIEFTYKGEAFTATIGDTDGSTANVLEVQNAINASLATAFEGALGATAGDVIVTFENGTDLKLAAKGAGDSLMGGNFTDVNGVIASDSYWSTAGDTWDIITGFNVDHDKLDLPESVDGLYGTNGIFDVDNDFLNGKLMALANAIGSDNKVGAFEFDDSVYIFQNTDGDAVITKTDIFIQLIGVQLDSLEGLII